MPPAEREPQTQASVGRGPTAPSHFLSVAAAERRKGHVLRQRRRGEHPSHNLSRASSRAARLQAQRGNHKKVPLSPPRHQPTRRISVFDVFATTSSRRSHTWRLPSRRWRGGCERFPSLPHRRRRRDALWQTYSSCVHERTNCGMCMGHVLGGRVPCTCTCSVVVSTARANADGRRRPGVKNWRRG